MLPAPSTHVVAIVLSKVSSSASSIIYEVFSESGGTVLLRYKSAIMVLLKMTDVKFLDALNYNAAAHSVLNGWLKRGHVQL